LGKSDFVNKYVAEFRSTQVDGGTQYTGIVWSEHAGDSHYFASLKHCGDSFSFECPCASAHPVCCKHVIALACVVTVEEGGYKTWADIPKELSIKPPYRRGLTPQILAYAPRVTLSEVRKRYLGTLIGKDKYKDAALEGMMSGYNVVYPDDDPRSEGRRVTVQAVKKRRIMSKIKSNRNAVTEEEENAKAEGRERQVCHCREGWTPSKDPVERAKLVMCNKCFEVYHRKCIKKKPKGDMFTCDHCST